MRVIIWGIGDYCNQKIDFINEEIVAFVSREKTLFRGFATILPNEIKKYDFDKLYILSNSYFDIIIDAINLGIDCKKIVPGMAIYPLTFNELEYVSKELSDIKVQQDASIVFKYIDGEEIKVKNTNELKLLKRKVCDEDNAKFIGRLSCRPVGKLYGGDRGGSIVRYYIENFLEKEREFIVGDVLEVGDNIYTMKYGKNINHHILVYDKELCGTENTFYGDLQTGEGIMESQYNCIILTQVLNFVNDISKTPEVLVKSLKPGGVLLMTVSGITPVCRYDMERYGQYWSFTEKSIFNMFKAENVDIEIENYGNFKTACAFLAGVSYTEMSKNDMEYKDDDFPVVIAAKIVKN